MLSDYLPILLLLGLSTLFGVASIWVASKMGPHNPSPAKEQPYECGITPERLPRERFPVKFYLIAMLFIIFDVEIVFFYPWAVILRELGLFGLIEMAVFAAFLLVAYLYIYKRGGLDWDEESRSVLRRFGAGIERSLLRGPGERGAGAVPTFEPPSAKPAEQEPIGV